MNKEEIAQLDQDLEYHIFSRDMHKMAGLTREQYKQETIAFTESTPEERREKYSNVLAWLKEWKLEDAIRMWFGDGEV